MRAGVPAMARQIDAAAKGQLIVDDDDLLMVAGADRMMVVEAEAHAAVACATAAASASAARARACRPSRNPRSGCSNAARAARCVTNAISSSSRVGASVASRAGLEIDRGRDVPAENEDRVARVEQRASHQPEIVGGILDAVEASARSTRQQFLPG